MNKFNWPWSFTILKLHKCVQFASLILITFVDINFRGLKYSFKEKLIRCECVIRNCTSMSPSFIVTTQQRDPRTLVY